MFVNISSLTQCITSESYITWQLVSALNMGHHQAIMQEHKNIYRNSMYIPYTFFM